MSSLLSSSVWLRIHQTRGLYAYLAEHNQTATHFMIGSNIIQYPTEFLKAFGQGDDIAVHTWTHPYMTTLSNEVVVVELGWTVQVIHNSTGGRVPRFWRPPYGDSDMRTHAIAKEVSGLTTVVWNQDTNWSLSDSPPGTTAAKINASMTQWLTGPKSPGLIILEHELSNQSVASFQAAYPMMLSTGWQVTSLAKLMGNGSSYQNSASDEGAVVPVGNILNAVNVTVPLASSSASAIITPTTSAAKQATPAQASASPSRVALSMGPSVGLATAVAAALFGMLCA
ncbi:hypothetical protein GGX14DRAFT_558943 [Mycena pura]|uniref:chitin deacetylase n=1 Tax=Mycena pura TaxID=153505 RepID=A0AAD6VSG9_9AGAR|nr:hypothetical protein GGX14DRAFT_558943 [Mycena pura]